MAHTAASTSPPTNCPVCNSSSLTRRFCVNGFDILQCEGCRFEFAWPIPSEEQLGKFYENSYVCGQEVSRRDFSQISLLNEIGKRKPSGRLLEIGCGKGLLLLEAKKRGYAAEGVELSPSSAAEARALSGVPIHCEALEAFTERQTRGSYDVVVARHVIEHLRDPAATLKVIHSLLRPGGLVALVVPNIRGLASRAFGRDWEWMCPPIHLHYFSAKSLRLSLTSLHFHDIKMRTRRGDAKNFYLAAGVAGIKKLGLDKGVRDLLAAPEASRPPSEIDPHPPQAIDTRSLPWRVAVSSTRLLYGLTFPLHWLTWIAGLGEQIEAFALAG